MVIDPGGYIVSFLIKNCGEEEGEVGQMSTTTTAEGFGRSSSGSEEVFQRFRQDYQDKINCLKEEERRRVIEIRDEIGREIEFWENQKAEIELLQEQMVAHEYRTLSRVTEPPEPLATLGEQISKIQARVGR